MEGVLETAAAGIGAAFGTGAVSPTLAAALRSLLPDALFLRCGCSLAGWDGRVQGAGRAGRAGSPAPAARPPGLLRRPVALARCTCPPARLMHLLPWPRL